MDNRILLVEDDASIREKFKERLDREGYKTTAVASAEEALRVLKRQNIHVMFLDLNLPKMNGVDLCRKIRESNPVACVFAVTGFSSLFELAACREAGFDDYFTKPVKLDALAKAAKEGFEKLERWMTW